MGKGSMRARVWGKRLLWSPSNTQGDDVWFGNIAVHGQGQLRAATAVLGSRRLCFSKFLVPQRTPPSDPDALGPFSFCVMAWETKY